MYGIRDELLEKEKSGKYKDGVGNVEDDVDAIHLK